MSIKPIDDENNNDDIRPPTRLSERKTSITFTTSIPYNEDDNEDDNEIVPSARLTERRSGLISKSKKHRKTMDICKECLHSIYEEDNYYSCTKCKSKLCFICWEHNYRCPGCNSKIPKSESYISFKKINYNWLHNLFRKFTKCFLS